MANSILSMSARSRGGGRGITQVRGTERYQQAGPGCSESLTHGNPWESGEPFQSPGHSFHSLNGRNLWRLLKHKEETLHGAREGAGSGERFY